MNEFSAHSNTGERFSEKAEILAVDAGFLKSLTARGFKWVFAIFDDSAGYFESIAPNYGAGLAYEEYLAGRCVVTEAGSSAGVHNAGSNCALILNRGNQESTTCGSFVYCPQQPYASFAFAHASSKDF